MKKQKKGDIRLNKFFIKFGSAFAMFALTIGILTSNSACRLFYFQNDVPEDLKKIK